MLLLLLKIIMMIITNDARDMFTHPYSSLRSNDIMLLFVSCDSVTLGPKVKEI